MKDMNRLHRFFIATPRRKGAGFTIVELLIVIAVIGILAAISIVSYNGIQERARNTDRITATRDLVNVIEVANMLSPPTNLEHLNYFCLANEPPTRLPSGGYNCGEDKLPPRYTFEYNEELITALKKVTPTLPSFIKVDEWADNDATFYSPALITYNRWYYEDGRQLTAMLEFWLEGSRRSCDLPTVTINYPDDVWVPGTTGTIVPSSNGYSYSDSRVTYCYVPLEADVSSWRS